MADTLADKLNQEPTITEAASGEVLPRTPAGAKLIGAGDDAAKMAGTKIQKKAAQLAEQRAQPAQQKLSYQKRTEGVRTAQTEAEESAQRRAAQLRQLGSLGSRVSDLVQKNLEEKLATPEVAEVSVEDASALGDQFTNLDETKQNQLIRDINRFYAASPDERVQILADISNNFEGLQLTEDNISSLIGGIEGATGKSVASLAMDNVTAGDLATGGQLAEMGISSLAELSETLGVPEAELEGMTLQQITDQVEAVQAAEFGRVRDLEQRLADPNLSSAEREILLRQLRDLGGVGVTGIEDQMESLTQVVGEGNIVRVGERDMTWEELLSDDNFSELIGDYVSESATEEQRDDIEAILGQDVTDLISQHSEAFRKLVAGAKEDLGTFQDVQGKRKLVSARLTEDEGAPFDPEEDKALLDKLFPGWDKAGTEAHTWADTDLYRGVAQGDLDSALDYLFGEDVDVDKINNQFKDLIELSKTSHGGFTLLGGDDESRAAIRELDIDGDGVIDNNLVDLLKTRGVDKTRELGDKLYKLLKGAPAKLREIEAEKTRSTEAAKKDAADTRAKEEFDKKEADLYDRISKLFKYRPTDPEVSKLRAQYKQLTGRQWSSAYRDKNPKTRMTQEQRDRAKYEGEYKDYIRGLSSWRRPTFEEWLREVKRG